MSLYEGIDVETSLKNDRDDSWSSQIKLLQSQLHLKKSQTTFKPRTKSISLNKEETQQTNPLPEELLNADDEESFPYVEDEYDPKYPNDYDRVMSIKDEEKERQRTDLWKKELEERDKRRREKLDRNMARKELYAQDEDDEYDNTGRNASGKSMNPGAQIAPPPSVLSDVATIVVPGSEEHDSDDKNVKGTKFAPTLRGSVAAKIMAKYGFKHGQGLGKSEQGMSQALQVEKTSKRGGKILHEKDILPITHKQNQNLDSLNQLYGGLEADDPSLSPSLTFDHDEPQEQMQEMSNVETLESIEQRLEALQHEHKNSELNNSTLPNSDHKTSQHPTNDPQSSSNPDFNMPLDQQNIQAFKTPSKVVLLRNMVGPGEIDAELEEETKEECSKYGEVRGCTVFEIPPSFFQNKRADQPVSDLDRVRIFVEFARPESAVKAVIDLNGRFFGGRIVKADFYNLDKYRTYDLGEGI